MPRALGVHARLRGLLVLVVVATACSGGGSNSRGTAVVAPSTSMPSGGATSTSVARRGAAATAKKKAATKKKATKASTTTVPGSGSSQTTWSSGGTDDGGSGASVARQASPGGGGSASTPQTPPTTAYVPKPYDPSKPIDLGGVPGVSAAQQARAEKLIRDTLRDLPKYANPTAAYNDGYRTINDAGTGDEHYVKWAYVDDGRILDSKHPESLVYEMRNGKKTLVAAMYMMPFGSRFTDVPDVGGKLTQWHIHNDLCLADNPADPLQKVLSGFTNGNGGCPPGTTTAGNTPMLHVWIVANKCGPFAALEGIGGGQVPPGEERLCDRVHGAP